MRLQNLSVAQVHVHAARQAWIEAANRTHDVDSLEFVRPVFLEDRRVLHRVFVGAWRAIRIARIGVPRRRRIGMIIGDLVLANHHVMRQDAAHRFVESASNRLFGNLEVVPGAACGRRAARPAPVRRSESAAAAAYAWK